MAEAGSPRRKSTGPCRSAGRCANTLTATHHRGRTPLPGGGWFFPSPCGTWWDPDNFSADLREANKEAGLPWACLDYRHTFGSQLAQRGVSLFKVATLMGNSPEICRRHYAALTPGELACDVEFSAPLLTNAKGA